MEFGGSPDINQLIHSPSQVKEFPECEQNCRAALQVQNQKCNKYLTNSDLCNGEMAATEDILVTKSQITRMSASKTCSMDRPRRVHFGENITVEEFTSELLYTKDPNESAVDMIEAYKQECYNLRIKPITKLLEQLARLDYLSVPIDTLDLNNVRLDNRSCEALEAVLSRMSMTSINLERTNLDDDGMIAICEMVEFYECASRLSFGGNSKLKTRAWLFFGRMLKKVHFVEMVDIKQCGLDEQSLTLMLRAVRANCTLRTLHLEGNNLSGKGIFILMAAMKFNENLKELYLGGNRIGPEDCQNIGNILRTNHTLTCLDLRDNNIQNFGLRFVCAGIAEQQTGLLALNLAYNNITPEGMHHIAVMLPCTKSLQDINLSNNRIGDYGMMTTKLSLLANRSLLRFTLCKTNITCEGAIALAEFVAENRIIEQIDLRDNDIRIAGLMALSLAYRMNFRLLHLLMPRTIKIEQRDKEMAKSLMANIEVYSTRNMKEARQRRQNSPLNDDEPPTKSAASEEDEKRLLSSLDSCSETGEDPFSADIVSSQDVAAGKGLEKALDSMLLVSTNSATEEDDSSKAVEQTVETQQTSPDVDLISSNAVMGTPSAGDETVLEDSPTLPDVVETSFAPNVVVATAPNVLESHLEEEQPTSSTTKGMSTPDLMSEEHVSNVEIPLDIAGTVTHPSLDLLAGEEVTATHQGVDNTHGTSTGSTDNNSLLNTNVTPDVSQVSQSPRSELAVDLVDGHNSGVFGAGNPSDLLDNRPL